MKPVITGIGLALPGVVALTDLLGPARENPAPVDPPAVDPPAVDPAERLGRKGLRYKDRATQLGLCAADEALRSAGLWDGADRRLTVPDRSVAVVVSSNLGNVDTVCRVAQTIKEEGTRGVSPMDTPNASSNILASEVAIRFGLRGPNLMLCNGPTGGLDAVHWARTLLRAGRADHVLVVGVEPDNEMVRQFADSDRVLDGGAAFVLERPEHASDRGARVHAGIGGYVRTGGVSDCAARLAKVDSADVWFVPEGTGGWPDPGVDVTKHDLGLRWGTCSGALGVLQCVTAAGWFAQGGHGPVMALSGNDSDDATAGLLLYAGDRP